MSYLLQLHPLVQQDYNEAYKWYEDQQKGLGERFLKAVRGKIEQIIVRPQVFGSRSSKKFREAKIEFFPYHIVYKINERKKEIYISSIHHKSKHPNKKYRKGGI
jgi:plasmid stabilization system protein ParE